MRQCFYMLYIYFCFEKSQFLNATLNITKYKTNDSIAPHIKSTIECCFKNIVDRQMHIVNISEPILIRLPTLEVFKTELCIKHICAEIVANTWILGNTLVGVSVVYKNLTIFPKKL